MLFLFELRRQGAGVRVKVFTLDWVGSWILAALTLASQAPLFFLSRQTRDQTLTLHDTYSVREMTTEKCPQVPNIQIQPREIINIMLKVKIQGRVWD